MLVKFRGKPPPTAAGNPRSGRSPAFPPSTKARRAPPPPRAARPGIPCPPPCPPVPPATGPKTAGPRRWPARGTAETPLQPPCRRTAATSPPANPPRMLQQNTEKLDAGISTGTHHGDGNTIHAAEHSQPPAFCDLNSSPATSVSSASRRCFPPPVSGLRPHPFPQPVCHRRPAGAFLLRFQASALIPSRSPVCHRRPAGAFLLRFQVSAQPSPLGRRHGAPHFAIGAHLSALPPCAFPPGFAFNRRAYDLIDRPTALAARMQPRTRTITSSNWRRSRPHTRLPPLVDRASNRRSHPPRPNLPLDAPTTSSNASITSSSAPITSSRRVRSRPSNPSITSSNPPITSSNPPITPPSRRVRLQLRSRPPARRSRPPARRYTSSRAPYINDTTGMNLY